MVPFTTLRVFNQARLRPLARCRGRIDARALAYFDSETLVDRLVRAFVARRAITIKELVESFEFFGRVRRRMRAPTGRQFLRRGQRRVCEYGQRR